MAQTAIEHARTILGGVIPDRKDRLEDALRHLTVDHFTDKDLRNVFVMLQRYANVTGYVLKQSAMADMLRASNVDAGRVALYEETFEFLSQLPVSDQDFSWSLLQIRELAAERATGEILTTAMEVLHRGVRDKHDKLHQGHEDARRHVLEGLAEIDRALSMQDAPEGVVQHEPDEMLADYVARKRSRLSGAPLGVYFGVGELDAKIGGYQPGDFNLFAGYTSSGKTTACTQLAWNAAINQGINVIYLTTETLRPQVRRKLIARHSMHDVFGMPDGLNTRDLRSGSLDDYHEAKFQDVINDFARNPAYGKINVVQLPRGANVSSAEAALLRIGRAMPVGLCVLDYAQLLKPDRRHNSDREGYSEVVKDLKQAATTFEEGNGVPLVSPWQVNRTSWEEAQRTGFYTTKATSETAEASNTADIIVSLLEPPENNDRRAELKAQVLKNRDGETSGSILLTVDYATSCFTGQGRGADEMESLLGGSGF